MATDGRMSRGLKMESIKEIYQKYWDGNPITDQELGQLLNASKSAIPYLSASPVFALALREAISDCETFERMQLARQSHYW